MTTVTEPELEALVDALRANDAADVELAFVLGSGLGGFADGLDDARAISYEELDGLPRSRVSGHAGRLVLGELDGVRVVACQGRVHLYEGWSAREVTRLVRALAEVGCPRFVLTNAAGGLHADWAPGTLMRVTDHINLQGRPPLAPPQRGARNPYDNPLGAALDRAAQSAGVELRRGVYVGLRGPSYETPAEVRFLATMGGDAVGMSTVAEAGALAALGAQVAGLSLITNPGAGLAGGKLDHGEVLAAGRAAAGTVERLLRALPTTLN